MIMPDSEPSCQLIRQNRDSLDMHLLDFGTTVKFCGSVLPKSNEIAFFSPQCIMRAMSAEVFSVQSVGLEPVLNTVRSST